jgi:hypothetical protein
MSDETKEPYESKTYPKASEIRGGVASLSKDDINLKNCAFQRTKGINRMWSVSDSCPLFRKPGSDKVVTDAQGRKKIVKRKKGDKNLTRINSVLKSHTIATLASGAAGNAAALLYDETQAMRLDTVAETSKYPLVHQFNKPCALLLSQAFSAYCAEAFANAVAIKKAIGRHNKPTIKCALAGVNILNAKLSAATGVVAPSMGARLVYGAPTAPTKTAASTKKTKSVKAA